MTLRPRPAVLLRIICTTAVFAFAVPLLIAAAQPAEATKPHARYKPAAASAPARGLRWERRTFSSARKLRAYVESRGGNWERFLRAHPAVVAAFDLYGVRWNGTTFFTVNALATSLRLRGETYRRWAALHRAAAVRLRRNARATYRPSAAAGTTRSDVFAAVADAHVESTSPRTNFGSAAKLQTATLPVSISYFRFDLRALDGEVYKATLELRPVEASGARFEVGGVRNVDWAENAVTFASAPSVSSNGVTFGIDDATSVRVDVTRLVDRGGVVCIAVTSQRPGAQLTVASRESNSGARLVVVSRRSSPSGSAPTGGSTTTPTTTTTKTTTPTTTTTPPPAPTSSTNPYRDKVGIGYHWWSNDNAAVELEEFKQMKANGIDWVRFDASWGAFEPENNQWNWALMDRINENARAAGLKRLAVIAGSPGWAGGDGCGSSSAWWCPPHNMADYGDAVRAYLTRYPGTEAIEIWNEPFLVNFWGPHAQPALYAQMVNVGAKAAKSVSPNVQVIACGQYQQIGHVTSGYECLRPFLTELKRIEPNIGQYIDGFAPHTYSEARPPEDTRGGEEWRYSAGLLTRKVAAEFGLNEQIWQTEFGWRSDEPPWDPYPATNERLQAEYTVRALQLAHGPGGWNYAPSFIYTWSKGADGYGVRREDGSFKPVWAAVGNLVKSGG